MVLEMLHPETPANDSSADAAMTTPEVWDGRELQRHSKSTITLARILNARGELKTSQQDLFDAMPTKSEYNSIWHESGMKGMIDSFLRNLMGGYPFVNGVRPDSEGITHLVYFFRKLSFRASTEVVRAALRVLREEVNPEGRPFSPQKDWVKITHGWLICALEVGDLTVGDIPLHAESDLYELAVLLVSSSFGLIETSRLLDDDLLPIRMERLLRTTLLSWGLPEQRVQHFLAL